MTSKIFINDNRESKSKKFGPDISIGDFFVYQNNLYKKMSIFSSHGIKCNAIKIDDNIGVYIEDFEYVELVDVTIYISNIKKE